MSEENEVAFPSFEIASWPIFEMNGKQRKLADWDSKNKCFVFNPKLTETEKTKLKKEMRLDEHGVPQPKSPAFS